MITALSCTHLRCIDRKDWIDADVLGIDEGQFFEDVSNCNKDSENKIIFFNHLISIFK